MQGRGKSFEETESYSFWFTDSVHIAFERAARSARSALLQISLTSCMSVHSVIMAASASAGASFLEGLPGTEHAFDHLPANPSLGEAVG